MIHHALRIVGMPETEGVQDLVNFYRGMPAAADVKAGSAIARSFRKTIKADQSYLGFLYLETFQLGDLRRSGGMRTDLFRFVNNSFFFADIYFFRITVLDEFTAELNVGILVYFCKFYSAIGRFFNFFKSTIYLPNFIIVAFFFIHDLVSDRHLFPPDLLLAIQFQVPG